MRYNHLDMLPEKAFQPVGKRMTLEGGGGKDGGGGSTSVPDFKPWAVATPTGSTTSKKGKISATLSPELQSFYDMYLAGAQAAMPSEQALQFSQDVSGFGEQLTREAIGMDTGAMASDYYNRQLALLAPGRAQEESRLADTLFKTGRTGAAIGYGNEGYLNPEQFALLKAREEQNAVMGLNAEDRARAIRNAQLQEGLGLFAGGEQIRTLPYQTSAGILGNSINLSNTLLPNIGYGLQAGQAQNQAAIAQAQAAAQQQGNSKGLIGGLANAGATFFRSPTAGAGLFSSLGTAASLGNIASTGALAVSDRRLKTNIKLIGSFKNGLNKYSWNYLWGTYSVGAMADEVEKVIPEAVVTINGYKAVNYALLGD